MTKGELIEIIAKNQAITNKKAKELVELVFTSIATNLKTDGEVEIAGFGKFTRVLQKGKTGIVPGTNKEYTTQDKYIPKFSAAKKLKEGVM